MPLFDTRLHFIAKSPRMRDGPFRAAKPLGGHHVADLFLHSNRRPRSSANQIANFFEIFFLAVHAFHQSAQTFEIELLRGDALQAFDQPTELGHHEVQPMLLEQFAPSIAAEFPPAGRQFGSAGRIERDELRAEGFGPDFETPAECSRR